MKKSRKILSIILTVLMILSAIPFAGLTAFAEDSDFIIDENGVLTGYRGSGGSICLPETVTEIKYNAFMNNNSITEVTIPGSVKTIGERAFEGCSNLQKVTMLEGVENLGQYLFWYCEKLETVILPDSIKDMGESCLFAGCSSIKSITLPKGIKTVGFAAFSGCASLSEIILPEGLETIGSNAFWQTSLKSIVIPSSVKNIGTTAFDNYSYKTFKSITFYTDKVKFEDNAFFGFNKDINFYCACNLDLESLQSKLTAANFKGTGEYLLHNFEHGVCSVCGIEKFVIDSNGVLIKYNGQDADVVIPDDVTAIGANAFKDNKYIRSITIPDSVTSIGECAFKDCSSLTGVVIPDGVTAIEGGTFDGCSLLVSLTIPDSVTSIGNYSMRYCSKLTSVDIPDGVTSIGNSAFEGCTGLTSVVIPNSVTSIGDSAFRDCSALTGVVIPDSITVIKGGTFDNCSSLTSLTIPDSVTSLGAYSIRFCSKLTSVVIPDSVTSLGTQAFFYCTGLEEITIPGGVTSIGGRAFEGCESLSKIYTCNVNGIKSMMSTYGTYEYVKLDHKLVDGFCTVCGGECEHSFTDGVCTICGKAEFEIDSDGVLTNYYGENADVVIPDGVKAIGANAFKDNTYIKNVTIPDGVTSIGDCAFSGSTIESITIPDSVKNMGNDVFGEDTSLTTVYCSCSNKIPNMMLMYGVFEYVRDDHHFVDGTCTACGHVCDHGGILGGTCSICGEVINGGFIIDENGVLTGYDGKGGDIVIPYEVTEIAENAFKDNSNITSVTVPFGTTNISSRAFNNCSALTTVTIPESVEYINSETFKNCTALTSITLHDSLTGIASDAFEGCTALTTVYYPCYSYGDVVTDLMSQVGDYTIAQHPHDYVDGYCSVCGEEDLRPVASEPFTDDADFETFVTENGTKIISGFNPGDTTAALDKYIAEGWDVSIKPVKENKIGTGTVITLTSLKGDLMEYTVVIYGDTDGDAWYDGMDSTYVNVLANGLLTKEDVSEAVWYASDCNHDGVIDALDVGILEKAGLALMEIDQTKSWSDLTEDSAFVEYLSLISQKTAAKEVPAEEAQTDTPADEPAAGKTTIQKIIDFIIYIFNLITSYISKVF